MKQLSKEDILELIKIINDEYYNNEVHCIAYSMNGFLMSGWHKPLERIMEDIDNAKEIKLLDKKDSMLNHRIVIRTENDCYTLECK